VAAESIAATTRKDWRRSADLSGLQRANRALELRDIIDGASLYT